jgi:hypothetical protein
MCSQAQPRNKKEAIYLYILSSLVPRLCLGMQSRRLCLLFKKRSNQKISRLSFPGSAWECSPGGSTSSLKKRSNQKITGVKLT